MHGMSFVFSRYIFYQHGYKAKDILDSAIYDLLWVSCYVIVQMTSTFVGERPISQCKTHVIFNASGTFKHGSCVNTSEAGRQST